MVTEQRFARMPLDVGARGVDVHRPSRIRRDRESQWSPVRRDHSGTGAECAASRATRSKSVLDASTGASTTVTASGGTPDWSWAVTSPSPAIIRAVSARREGLKVSPWRSFRTKRESRSVCDSRPSFVSVKGMTTKSAPVPARVPWPAADRAAASSVTPLGKAAAALCSWARWPGPPRRRRSPAHGTATSRLSPARPRPARRASRFWSWRTGVFGAADYPCPKGAPVTAP